mmetsp:Transcript_32129/g.78085  ORF Transcript_32129/g.78085 Transcript_32129/m.78085 type:complete len:366 (+) Transcript_32129:96-1193(+)|eukprot:CAMPEP_0113637948 /NCGR_PEP_ID=MMETSP0017_2-20120614/19874_1 /TAXON_ID=2856 /ORGANISM="Cylindrotheca closterium" /LENGTH=365 /DNA_ID=CAMNT_0000549021 /DNA_START=26 /DNA_END=1123 /DNA_ORIENTATION=- /assembly_acc=CAM_ASM_000147
MTVPVQTQGSMVSGMTQAETVRVVNNEETMALSQQQKEQQQQHEKEVQQEEVFAAPLSCVDNACDTMVRLFGAGSDKQDEVLENTIETTYANMTYANMVACVTPEKSLADNGEEDEEDNQAPQTWCASQEQAQAKQEPQEQAKPEQEEEQSPAPVTPEAKRTFGFGGKNNKRNKKKKKKKNKQGRVAPTGVTVDDDQVEARRKNRFGRWWKKKFQKDVKQRSKSVPRTRTRNDTIPPSPSTVRSQMQDDDVPSADYVDMTNVYNEPPTVASDTQSAASFQPRANKVESDSDDSEEEEESVNVWKELNDMWEESGHDLVRVVSDNLSVTEQQAAMAEEEDIMAKYEQAVAAEERLEHKSAPVELTV